MNRRPEELAERFFSGNAGSYDHIARVSTLGLDGWWKRKIIKKIPKTADRILEQASGTGILTCKIARLFPKCRVIGVELHEEYLNSCQKKSPRSRAEQRGIHSRQSGRRDFERGVRLHRVRLPCQICRP